MKDALYYPVDCFEIVEERAECYCESDERARGVAFSQELQAWIYHASRLADISENKVIVRLLQIGVEDLRPFDDAGLKRILAQPWHFARKIPALSRQMRKRDWGHLHAVTATRLTMAEKQTLRELAEKSKTTMSQLQRQVLERILAKEGSR